MCCAGVDRDADCERLSLTRRLRSNLGPHRTQIIIDTIIVISSVTLALLFLFSDDYEPHCFAIRKKLAILYLYLCYVCFQRLIMTDLVIVTFLVAIIKSYYGGIFREVRSGRIVPGLSNLSGGRVNT